MVNCLFHGSSTGVTYRRVHMTWPVVGSSTAAKCVHSFVVGHADTHEMTSLFVIVMESSIFATSRAASVSRGLCFISTFSNPNLVVTGAKLASFDCASVLSVSLSAICACRFIRRSAFLTLVLHLFAMHSLLSVLSRRTSTNEANSRFV